MRFRYLVMSLVAVPAAFLALQATTVQVAGDRAFANDTTSPDPNPAASKCKHLRKGTRKWKRCIEQNSNRFDVDDAFYAGYWLAKSGDYRGALEVLMPVAEAGDARVLTYIGFATRKLGDIENGIGYYKRALAANPNYNPAREYLGEGYLQKNDLEGALAQLAEIERRCGRACVEYRELASAIETFEKARTL